MLHKVFYFASTLVVTLTLVVLLSLPTPSGVVSGRNGLLIENAIVFNGEEFEHDIDLLIKDGLVQAMGKQLDSGSMEVMDASGKIIIPGLIDAHTHSFGDALSTTLTFGVTTHVDMFTPAELLGPAIKSRENNTQNLQADLFSAGTLATTAGGHGTQFGLPIETLDLASQAEGWVARRLEEGSDFIKLVYMPYNNYFKSLDRETAVAVINAAHAKGIMVVAHISSQRAARELLDDGIDGFVHVFADEIVDDEFIKKAKSRGVFIIATLSVIAAAAKQGLGTNLAQNPQVSPYLRESEKQMLNADFGSHDNPGFNFQLALANTGKMHRAGIQIVAGSDAQNPGTAYGASLHQELALLVEAGLTPAQALRSATKLPAQLFKLGTRGTLGKGSKADFIILNESPENDIGKTLNINAIYKNGVRVPRSLVTESSDRKADSIISAELSLFEEGLSTSSNMRWSKTDDSMTGGNSGAQLAVKDNVLHVLAQVKSGFMFPWAGASLFGNTPWDVSEYESIEFKVRGTQGSYQFMAFSGTQTGVPPSQKFNVNSEWQTISLSLKDFRGFDATRFTGLAIVAGPNLGKFEYYLNDVKLVR
jgi:imidazolonepropionase-like amidohydrolase